jgi:hypothetical protein
MSELGERPVPGLGGAALDVADLALVHADGGSELLLGEAKLATAAEHLSGQAEMVAKSLCLRLCLGTRGAGLLLDLLHECVERRRLAAHGGSEG